MKKLVLQPIRTLQNIFAASGLVKIGETFYVIADDDLALGIIEQYKEIKLVPLVAGTLPQEHKDRKKLKPDWEALVVVSKKNIPIELLAVPSGSTPNRQMGSFIAFKDDGLISTSVDFSKIYSSLLTSFPNLNIEGACFTQKCLQLFQRGNGSDAKSAVINLSLEGVLEDIRTTQILAQDRILGYKEYSLGKIGGIPLCFTDACFVNENETWFLAAAEAGASTYEDGGFAGAILGVLDDSGTVKDIFNLDIAHKPEGLSVEISDNNERIIHVVTDADSSEMPAVLYRGLVQF